MRPLSKKLVIFDLDGVLLDSNHLFMDVLTFSLESTFGDREQYISPSERIIGKGLEEILERFSCCNNFVSKRKEFFDCFHKNYIKKHNEMIVEDESIIQLLTVLKSKGYLLGIATSRDARRLSAIKNMNLTNYFDAIQGSCSEIKRKPAPDTIDNVIQKFSCQCDYVYIGDSLEDMQATKNSKYDINFIGALWFENVSFPKGVSVAKSPYVLLEKLGA